MNRKRKENESFKEYRRSQNVEQRVINQYLKGNYTHISAEVYKDKDTGLMTVERPGRTYKK